MRFRRLLSGVPLFMVLLASPAVAQQGGVHLDPNSPAGKEYAVPIEQARRAHADSNANGKQGSNGSTPLFGAGISPRSGGGPGNGGRTESSADGKAGPGKSGQGLSQGQKAASRARAAITASGNTGSSATFQTVAVVAAVLLAGSLLGLIVYRLRRRRSA